MHKNIKTSVFTTQDEFFIVTLTGGGVSLKVGKRKIRRKWAGGKFKSWCHHGKLNYCGISLNISAALRSDIHIRIFIRTKNFVSQIRKSLNIPVLLISVSVKILLTASGAQVLSLARYDIAWKFLIFKTHLYIWQEELSSQRWQHQWISRGRFTLFEPLQKNPYSIKKYQSWLYGYIKRYKICIEN